MRTWMPLLVIIFPAASNSQIVRDHEQGTITNHVSFYHLSIDIDPYKKFIPGDCEMTFSIADNADSLILGLFSNYTITKIAQEDKVLPYIRIGDRISIPMTELEYTSKTFTIVVSYCGYPPISGNPPWEGGFVWEKDSTGGPFVGVVCELDGAGIWWPALLDISDKPDSLLFSVAVPIGLQVISNGSLRSIDTTNNKVIFHWVNGEPIIPYNLTVYIGKYNKFIHEYQQHDVAYQVSYYSLQNNLDNAYRIFNQLDTVLRIFEYYFGTYPFSKTGYKVVDAPYAGMEHQTAIAFVKERKSIFGLLGYRTQIGYVLVHETAHEWWGNSVSVKSLTDLWINESLATYSESLFIEFLFGRKRATEYINQDLDYLIKNEIPVFDSNRITYNLDIYQKGSAIWNTFRSILNNDSLWFCFLRTLQKDYKHKSISTEELLLYISIFFEEDFSYFFDQYIYTNKIPVLQYYTDSLNSNLVYLRWFECIPHFQMPILCRSNNEDICISVSTSWNSFPNISMSPDSIKLLCGKYLIRTGKVGQIID